MADEFQLLCVVTPCYNEEEVIEKFLPFRAKPDRILNQRSLKLILSSIM